MISRRKTKAIKIGNVRIGAGYPIAIQSMVKASTRDTGKVISQIKMLKDAGCEIARLAVKDKDDAKALRQIKRKAAIPVVADIHFDWRLAIEAIDAGVDKIRLNPGNIFKKDQIRQIAKAAKSAGIPIRVGVNSGSVTSHKPQATSHKTMSMRMVKSALDYIRILEKFGFYDIVVSLKASDILNTVEAYGKMAKLCDYPFHLGVTATGSPFSGIIKSTAALSSLLLDGIGDTIRVSLTDIPEAEVRAAKSILEAVGLRSFGPEIISCPTCGRCEVDLVSIVKQLENSLAVFPDKRIKVAVMGCVVNGPGEARDADIGIAFGRKAGLLFKKGEALKKVSAEKCVNVLMEEIKRFS
ncbi:MAG: flavodoxin-dependent (E)-4-hydroxy-3-methylbut-2-enyl-diphosphate synthase [Candidatus Omnitrophica bacterium]|nr:flavodoxin-dependent (E)-4-hydroxy-3-methylbut-2-enyl-diphosphate synthase [Candidatus Omnitrophota bacterium]MDD5553609.1 flavodoxin-dependent (E)-4-hydroxy-3-methylbut-2-enyl-diphosphate synthase [Candidatus Omnitrophota bacterium]